jgi:hypothetical protein
MTSLKFRKHAWWLAPLTVVALGTCNWIVNEIRASIDLSRLDATMTRHEVVATLGEPDYQNRWYSASSSHEGDYFKYRYPYFWDYLLPFEETRTIEVHFRDGEEQLTWVGSHPAYTNGTRVVIRRRMAH